MHIQDWAYQTDTFNAQGFIAFDDSIKTPQPVVLVAHDWSGCNEFAKQQTQRLAALGYVGLAIDLYGEGQIGQSNDQKMKLMQPLLEDRSLIMQRWQAAITSLASLPQANTQKIAAIGFCFGGLCALDLARHTDTIRGVVSFHGLLNPPTTVTLSSIPARILVLHGYDDPMVPPEQVNQFAEEMTQAHADWQIHLYGHTQHAFTNPQANDATLGTIYNKLMAKRAWLQMEHFLIEIFE
ncbi:MAG: prolyl oligopeptidase family serine peptidase [Legionellales bacterium]|nr:prolyl oligopeptidase family serine peptidase [Legionellales bacterium]